MKQPLFDSVVFDLDGTLTESAPGIINSIVYALEKEGFPPLSEAELLSCIGPPLTEQLMHLLHISKERALTLLPIYREYFVRQGMFENRPYDGIVQLLSALREAGIKLYVCTGKPEPFARTILEHFHLAAYFADCIGSTLDGKLKEKAEALGILAERNGLKNPMMIGDRKYDVAGARAHGFSCTGVLWGYGTRQELELAGAAHCCETVAELQAYLLENVQGEKKA